MKALVFGGSGFLGSYVADELTKRKYKVVVVDIEEPKYLNGDQEFIKCDIMDREAVARAVSDDTKVIYNFAGLADINEAMDQPTRTIELNVLGNLNILEACRAKKIKRYVYASSAYAFSRKGSFYGISKYTSEKLIEEFYEKFGLEYTIIRYGSLYGERADDHNYIHMMLKRALVDKKIIVKEDEEEDVREYIHAKDAAALSVDVMEGDDYVNEHIILTGVEKMKRRELFQMIKEILGDSAVTVERVKGTHEGHYNVTPYSFHPNLAKKLVANPYIDMGQGLVECLKSINSEIEKSAAKSSD